MAKFNIEVELDWLEEGEGVDEEIRHQVIAGLQNKITHNVEREIKEKTSERINNEVDKVVSAYLETVTAEKIENIQIPHKENSWGSEVKLIPISEFIGQRFEAMVTEKTLDGNGNKYRRYDSKSGPYSMIEYLTKGYIAEELNEKVISMIQKARKQAEQTLIKNLEENLQQQLNADMVQKLNIPAMLENLQNTIAVEGDK
jgi:hypothetical protein